MGTNDLSFEKFERNLHSIWIGRDSSPFPGQIVPPDPKAAKSAARLLVDGSLTGLQRLFREAPCLGLWATLAPLAEKYGAGSAEVYRHIAEAFCINLQGPANRKCFKIMYKAAAVKIGVAVAGNDPTSLFFAPLGVADAQIQPLANALVAAMARLGPPAIEDTPSAVAWQRRSLAWCSETLTRIRAAVSFDQVGHYALRANRWRVGEPPETPRDEVLFAALDRASQAQCVRRDRIVAPPVLVWTHDGLALLAEPAKIAQSVRLGAFPTRLNKGVPCVLPTPWPDEILWKADRCEIVTCAPQDSEILIFDANTGALETRAILTSGTVFVVAQRVVALSTRKFEAETFGSAEGAKDSRYYLAWLELKGPTTLNFKTGEQIVLARSMEPSLSIDAIPIGRAGSRPLFAGQGALIIQVNPALPSPRILRITTDKGFRYEVVIPNPEGQSLVNFATLGFDRPGDPVRAVFEILALGTREDIDARAELRATAFVWPGVAREEGGDILDAPLPSMFDAARSTGFETARGRIWMAPETENDTAVLALKFAGELIEFRCPFRGVRLWHHRIATGERKRVARGARLVFSYANRNDTFTIQAPGCRADIRVLGHLIHQPFAGRMEYPIGAEMLEHGEDDRIVLEHPDGSSELLTRILRTNDPTELSVEDTGTAVLLAFRPQKPIDAIGVRIQTTENETLEGAAPLGPREVDARLPQGIEVRTLDNGRVKVIAAWPENSVPARMEISARLAGAQDFDTLRGADGHAVALGLSGATPAPDAQILGALSQLLAEPATAALGGQLSQALGPIHQKVLLEMGRARMASRVLPALAVECPSGNLPRGDILSGAPWLFEAPLTAFGRLANHPELGALGRMSNVPAPSDLPNPRDNDPLGAWLDRIATGDDLPRELAAGALDAAFIALRTRLNRPDLANMTSEGALGGAIRLLVSVDVPQLERLRNFDRTMGYNRFGAQMIAFIERYARASRLRSAEIAFDEMVRRTSLAPGDVGEALTLVCRVGVEALAHFLTLWNHAVQEHEPQLRSK